MSYTIRSIQITDNAAIATIIRSVSLEHGLGAAQGFAVGDSMLDDLAKYYMQPNAAYWVVVDAATNQVLGGGGVAPLVGEHSILEVQKMYFMPCIRGLGLAKQLLMQFENFARQHGFTALYLETTATLTKALALYDHFGFQTLTAPLGQTGHSHACEIYMQKRLGQLT